MESRSAWTDARLDDRFDHIDGELSALRTEMSEARRESREGFVLMGQRTDSLGGELRSEIGGLREELHTEIGGVRGELGGLRGEMTEFRSLMIRLYAAQTIALLGVIAAILARGG